MKSFKQFFLEDRASVAKITQSPRDSIRGGLVPAIKIGNDVISGIVGGYHPYEKAFNLYPHLRTKPIEYLRGFRGFHALGKPNSFISMDMADQFEKLRSKEYLGELEENRSDDFYCFHCDSTFESPEKLNAHHKNLTYLKIKQLPQKVLKIRRNIQDENV